MSWRWAGVVDAHALIGSSRLPIFRLVSCPSLVCVQLCFGMEARCLVALSLSTSHHGNSLRARSLALIHTLLCHFFLNKIIDLHILIVSAFSCCPRKANCEMKFGSKGQNKPLFPPSILLFLQESSFFRWICQWLTHMWYDGWWLVTTTSHLLNLIFCVIALASQIIYFFLLSTFASTREFLKKEKKEEEVLLFAWHEVSTFHFPGLPHQQREYTWPQCKEEEQKTVSRRKKCKNRPQRGEKREEHPILATLSL